MSGGVVKGFCPTLARPMETGDGWLVRLGAPQGALTAAQVQCIAACAARYGNGHIDLTARGNLQLRGVTMEGYAALREVLAALGLAREPALSLLVSPLAGVDPACDARALEAAAALEAGVAACGLALPAKFFCVVDGGGVLPLAQVPADVYFSPPFHLPAMLARVRAAAAQGCRKVAVRPQECIPPYGYIPLTERSGAVGIGVPFGRVESGGLREIAALAAQFGDGTLRLAPWRMVFIPGVASADAPALLREAEAAGFILHALDARRAVQACPGAPACSAAQGETRTLALAVAGVLGAGRSVHVSGCAKGCACAGRAAVAITARGGAYDVAFDARAGAPPAYAGLSAHEVVQRMAKWEAA